MVTKVNPVTDYSVGRSFIGKSLTPLQIDLIADASAENGPDEAIEGVLQQVAEVATIVAYSPLFDTDTQILVWVEGDFPTDTFDGTNSETLAAYLQTTIRALGSTYGPNNFDLSGATVATPAGANGVAVMYADDVDDHA